jgi:opacity protein-like surface antigen
MKSILLSTASIALSLSAAASPQAYYIGTYGGANWDDVLEVSSPWISSESNTGYVVGGVLGTTVPSLPGLRFEVDISHRKNGVDLVVWKTPLSVDHTTFGLLANGVYDVPVDLAFLHPYVLVGAGYAHSTMTLEDIHLASVESSGFAWQLGAGVNTELTPGVYLGLGYRYFQGPEIEVLSTELSSGSNHSVLASLNFSLN